jgi:predicted nucleic acid-binding protein
MRWYLDASVALHATLPGGDSRARDWLDAARRAGDEAYSSSLLHLELIRVLRRERLDPALALPVLDRINLVSIDDGVLRFAAMIEPHVKSLDAIHLATCSLLGAGLAVVTHDAGMAEVAALLGLDAFDPLSPGA